MKKTFVVLLILAVAGGVFAQELKWSGALKTGVQFYADNRDSPDGKGGTYTKDPGFRLYSDDAEQNLGRVDLTATFTYNNIGVKANLRYQNVTDVLFNNAYGWVDFLDGKLNMKAGRIDDGVWRGGGAQNFNISTGAGVRFEVKPIEGLNVGVFLTGPEGEGFPHQGDKNHPYVPIGDFLAETAIGASYTADAFDVSFGLKLDGDDAGSYIDQGDFTGAGGVKDYAASKAVKGGINAYIGFNLKAVENLTATIEAAFNQLGNFGGDPINKLGKNGGSDGHSYKEDLEGLGAIWANENIGYQISEPLGVGLLMHQFIYGGKVDVPNTYSSVDTAANAWLQPELRFTPYVNYAISDAFTVGLKGTYTVKPDWYNLKLDIKPNLSFKLSDNATISAFYKFGIENTTKYAVDGNKIVLATLKNTEEKDLTTHTVQVDFIWTF